jgi:hypothetical protein
VVAGTESGERERPQRHRLGGVVADAPRPTQGRLQGRHRGGRVGAEQDRPFDHRGPRGGHLGAGGVGLGAGAGAGLGRLVAPPQVRQHLGAGGIRLGRHGREPEAARVAGGVREGDQGAGRVSARPAGLGDGPAEGGRRERRRSGRLERGRGPGDGHGVVAQHGAARRRGGGGVGPEGVGAVRPPLEDLLGQAPDLLGVGLVRHARSAGVIVEDWRVDDNGHRPHGERNSTRKTEASSLR